MIIGDQHMVNGFTFMLVHGYGCNFDLFIDINYNIGSLISNNPRKSLCIYKL